MALWAPARHCCFCLQLSGATSCALWEGQTHFSRCVVTSLLLGWLHTRALNRVWKNEDIPVSFSVCWHRGCSQQASSCPIIRRGTLANSVSAYYCNCMCTILSLMQAGCVNRERLFFFFSCCAVTENYWGAVTPCCVLLLHCNTNTISSVTGFYLHLQTWSSFYLHR